MKRVYISHAYGAKEENKRDVERIVRKLINECPISRFDADRIEPYMPISPIHAFGYLYDDVSYQQGINWCLQLLKNCDALLITGENWRESIGVGIEIKYAEDNGIPIYRLKTDGDIVMMDKGKEVF